MQIHELYSQVRSELRYVSDDPDSWIKVTSAADTILRNYDNYNHNRSFLREIIGKKFAVFVSEWCDTLKGIAVRYDRTNIYVSDLIADLEQFTALYPNYYDICASAGAVFDSECDSDPEYWCGEYSETQGYVSCIRDIADNLGYTLIMR